MQVNAPRKQLDVPPNQKTSGFASIAGEPARRLVRRLVGLYYPTIEVTNRELIPATGPVLFVSNHANSLMDPVIIGIAAHRPVHFLAKAPLFEVPILGPVMRALGMLPAYRGKDDPSQVGQNTKSLAAAAEFLVRGETVGIFPEGKSHDALKVDKVRSGAARIAVQAVQSGVRELKIVPLGINYERKESFRSAIWVRVGEPINAGAWMDQQGGDEHQAMRALTVEIDRRLKEVVVHLNEEKWEPFLYDLEILVPAAPENSQNSIAALRQRKRIADAMNFFLASDRTQAESLAASINAHREHVHTAGLSVRSAVLRSRGLLVSLRLAGEALWLALWFVPAFLGAAHHLVPFFLIRLIAPRLMAPGRTTVALTRFGLGLPILGLWYGFVWWAMMRYFVPWVAWTWMLAMPFAGVLALNYFARAREAGKLWWHQTLILFQRGKLKELRREHLALRDQLKEKAEAYGRIQPREPEMFSISKPNWGWRCFLPWILTFAVALAAAAADSQRVLDGKLYHLGKAGEPEWEEIAGKIPHGRRLDIRFTAQTNPQESALFIRQDGVKLDWGVELNGRKLGKLFLMEADLENALPIPPGTLRDGENTLSITPPRETDDIIVGEVKLDSRPLSEALNQATIEIKVSDRETRAGIPCRITLVDNRGVLTPIYARSNQQLAVRPGVVYTGNGQARAGVRPGDYTLYATRGFEYSLDSQKISVSAGQTRRVQMRIRREVPTPGLVSCDTHVHTFTFSGHGDATIEERMLTLAGEGIELPIATDHNCLTDYSGAAEHMKVQDRFTSVIGSEITTPTGHFNVFPIEPGSRVPDFRLTDWPKLMQSIRSTPGVRVVVLNHPRNWHSNFQPFAATNFNSVTGENLRGPEFSFDAIELVNSSALQSDILLAYRDWFALLNHGYRVTGVGSSDVHDVSRYIVGQGRSYVVCDDSSTAKLNVSEACRSFLEGRVLVSMGLLAQMTVNDRFDVGDLATHVGEKMRVTVTVLGPSWIRADQVELFANGVKIREQRIDSRSRAVIKAKHTWEIPRPAHDVHLVAIASGPPVSAPYWAIPHPYQSSSRIWKPRVIGSTNPIWVDADGDGKFTAPRAYAKALVDRVGIDPAKLLPALAAYDEAVAAQAASFCQAAGQDVRSSEFVRLLQNAPEPTRRGFAAFAVTVKP